MVTMVIVWTFSACSSGLHAFLKAELVWRPAETMEGAHKLLPAASCYLL